jgi:hypothetical protein
MGNIGTIVQALLTGIQAWQLHFAALAFVGVLIAMVAHMMPFRAGLYTLFVIAFLFSAIEIVNQIPVGG